MTNTSVPRAMHYGINEARIQIFLELTMPLYHVFRSGFLMGTHSGFIFKLWYIGLTWKLMWKCG